MTSISSQLASDGRIHSTAWASKPITAWSSYTRCCKSVEWEADNSSIKDWHCKIQTKTYWTACSFPRNQGAEYIDYWPCNRWAAEKACNIPEEQYMIERHLKVLPTYNILNFILYL